MNIARLIGLVVIPTLLQLLSGCTPAVVIATDLPPTVLSGRAIDGSGNAIVGAQVELFAGVVAVDATNALTPLSTGLLTASTGLDGLFSFQLASTIADTTVALALIKPGSDRRTFALSAPLTPPKGKTTTASDLALWTGATTKVIGVSDRLRIEWTQAPTPTSRVIIAIDDASRQQVIWRAEATTSPVELPLSILPLDLSTPTITLLTEDSQGTRYAQAVTTATLQSSLTRVVSHRDAVTIKDGTGVNQSALLDEQYDSVIAPVQQLTVDLQQPYELKVIAFYHLQLEAQGSVTLRVDGSTSLADGASWINLGGTQLAISSDLARYWAVEVTPDAGLFRYLRIYLQGCEAGCSDRFSLAEVRVYGE